MLRRRFPSIFLLLALVVLTLAPVRGAAGPDPVSYIAFPRALLLERWQPPRIVPHFLPWRRWVNEDRRYFRILTHEDTIVLHPQILVMHYTATRTFREAYRIFLRGCHMSVGRTTMWGHPSVHFMIDRDGTIYQLLPTDVRGTGTYGVNHVALQVEMVARNEHDLLHNPRLVRSGLRLARDLVERFNIPIDKVYGHMDVSEGRSVVPEYLDLADPIYPDRYPPGCVRTDPGRTFMQWLHRYLWATVGE